MTGLDCLREEMIKRGCTKQQVNSRVVPIILDILAETGTLYTDVDDLEQKRTEQQRNLERRELAIATEWSRCIQTAKDTAAYMEMVDERISEFKEYIEKFNHSLENCETAEGSDKLRLAQMFRNSVSINTVYDNTEYIRGLWAILAGSETAAAVQELKKVVPQTFPDGDEEEPRRAQKKTRRAFN